MLWTIAILGLLMTVFASLLAQSSPNPQGFEVATVKPSDPLSLDSGIHQSPSRFSATNQTLKGLVVFAYDIQIYTVSGGPSWTGSEKYDVIGKTPDDLVHTVKPGYAKTFVQGLLTERFKLETHREYREIPFYELVIAKGGTKLQLTKAVGNSRNLSGRNTHLNASGVPLSMLVSYLAKALQRLVVDRTQLTEHYDFELNWGPDPNPVVYDPDRPVIESYGPSIFTALQEQLGLKLEAKKGPIEVVVIDHAERPGEN